MASTKVSNDLNKTWTLLPEEEAGEEEEEEKEQEPDPEPIPDDELSKMSFAQMTFSQMNSHSMLLDEQAPMGFSNTTNNTTSNRYSLNVTNTINPNSPGANATIVKSKNMNVTVTCFSGSSPSNSSPSSHRLSSGSNASADYYNRFNDDMHALFLKRFQFIDTIKCDSLFEETINGLEFENGDPICDSNPSSPKLTRSVGGVAKSLNRTISLEKPIQANNPEPINKTSVKPRHHHHQQQQQQHVVSLTNSTSSLSSSLDNINERLVNDENVADDYVLLPVDPFEARSVPKTFDLFLNDLKKSSSSLDINRPLSNQTSSHATADDMRLVTTTAPTSSTTISRQFALPKFDFNRILTSSVDKDLNLIKKPVEPPSNLADIRKAKLNRTIDLEKPSASSSSATSSTSSSSSFLVDAHEAANAHNFKLPEVLPQNSEPEVFNSTYTYSLDPDQVEMDFLQQKKHEQQLLTRQQHRQHVEDMLNNNSNKNDDLNRTKDIITTNDDDNDTDELNKTRDLTDRNAGPDRFKTLVKRPGIVPPSTVAPASRMSSIYKASKLPSTTTTITTTTGSSQLKQPEVNKIPRPTSIVKPTSLAAPTSKLPSSGIPRVGVVARVGIKSPTTTTTTVKSPSNGKQVGVVRAPVTTTTTTTNLNRLSSTSTSSSSSSSSSLKENKKSPLTKQATLPNPTVPTVGAKSPGASTVSKITTTAFNNNPNIMNINGPALSKLRPPTQLIAPQPVTNTLTMNNKINDPSKIVPNRNITNQMSVDLTAQKQIAKPSMIPSLKSSSSIPMFRNTTNSQIKKL